MTRSVKTAHVCTRCGRKSGILHLPAVNPDPDTVVHPGERLCKKCLDLRLDGRTDSFALTKKPASSCCGGSEDAGYFCQHN